MSQSAKTLGQEPAYPKLTTAVSENSEFPDYSLNGHMGLSKREAFAMAAMQGLCQHAAPDYTTGFSKQIFYTYLSSTPSEGSSPIIT